MFDLTNDLTIFCMVDTEKIYLIKKYPEMLHENQIFETSFTEDCKDSFSIHLNADIQNRL